MYDFSNKSIKYNLIFDIPCVFLKKRQINRKKVNIHSLYSVLLKHCTCGSFRVFFLMMDGVIDLIVRKVLHTQSLRGDSGWCEGTLSAA